MTLTFPPGSIQDIAGRKLLGAIEAREGWTPSPYDNPAAPMTAQHYTGPLKFGQFAECLWANVYWSLGPVGQDDHPGEWRWFVKDDRPEARRPGGFNDHAAESGRTYADPGEAMDAADAALAGLMAKESA